MTKEEVLAKIEELKEELEKKERCMKNEGS